jgi:hypothetical protein
MLFHAFSTVDRPISVFRATLAMASSTALQFFESLTDAQKEPKIALDGYTLWRPHSPQP